MGPSLPHFYILPLFACQAACVAPPRPPSARVANDPHVVAPPRPFCCRHCAIPKHCPFQPLVQGPFTDCNTLASFTPPLCRHFAESVLTTKDRNFACRLRTSSSQEPPTHRQLLSKTVCVRHIPTFVDPSRATTDHSTAVKVSRHHDFLDALGSSYPVPTAISTLSRRFHCQRGMWSRSRESDALKGKKNSTIETVTAASTNSS